MIYGYIRVSTDKQTVENQRFEIENFVHKENVKIDRWIEEIVSGTVSFEKRKLGSLLKKMKKRDVLVASEISRLGRNLLQIMSILHYCMINDMQVWTVKDNYRLGTDIQSKVLAFAFGLSAEIERNLISQRTKEALARIKAEGRKLGRVCGSRNTSHKLDNKDNQIFSLLDKGISQNKIAEMLHVHRNTVNKFVKVHLKELNNSKGP
jgi:DNA invertase Pin-like site-specific DNA recombinase